MKEYKKLNLGCGKDYKEGWINVDVSADFKVDLIADLSKKFPFSDNSVDEIFASDILEHFIKENGEEFLKECYRVLKIGGTITIRTHSIYQIFEQFSSDPLVLIHFLYGDTQETDVFGSHKYAYTEQSLRHRLSIIGFDVVSFEKETTNFLVKAKKKEHKEEKLTIGIIMQSPDMGGAEMYMLSLIREFIGKKDRVLVASNKEKFLDKAKAIPVKTYEIPIILDIIGNCRGLVKSVLLLPYALYYYNNLLKEFKHKNVSVILMSNFTEKLLVTFLSIFHHTPVVWIEYGRLETVFGKHFYVPKIIYRLLKDTPKNIIVPSKNTFGSIITDARVSMAKLALIPLGVPSGKKKKVKSEMDQQFQNKFIIGNVSRLTAEKGQEYLIRAMSSVIPENPQVHLIIVGDGPDRELFQQLVYDLKLDSYVTITGFVKDLSDYYSIMDVFVFPTIWDLEGFGLVVPEAMSHKLPVIASSIGPVPEIVDDNKTGILVEPKDSKLITQAILRLLHNPLERKELGENGYKKFLKKYTIQTSSSKIREILHEATIK